MSRNGWAAAAWTAALVGLALAVSVVQNALGSGGSAVVLVALSIVAVNAALWGLSAFGLWHRRRWAVHLGSGCAVLNLLQGIAATASAGAAARALAEQGLTAHDTFFTAALSWVPTIGSGIFLLAVVLIRRAGPAVA
jgi:hypothetical protein